MFFDEYCRLCNKVGKAPTACAIEMGFHKSEVTRWKNGTVPRRANLLRIAEYFGVDADDLLVDAKKEQPEKVGLSQVQQMLIAEIPQMSDEDVSTLLILAKQLTRRSQSGDAPKSTE